MTAALTPRQVQILELLRESVDANGYAPSVREIADEVGLSSGSSAAHHLRELQDLGYIERVGPRAFKIHDPGTVVVPPISEPERLTIRMRILTDLKEMEVAQPETIATALAYQLRPTLEALLLARASKNGANQ